MIFKDYIYIYYPDDVKWYEFADDGRAGCVDSYSTNGNSIINDPNIYMVIISRWDILAPCHHLLNDYIIN